MLLLLAITMDSLTDRVWEAALQVLCSPTNSGLHSHPPQKKVESYSSKLSIETSILPSQSEKVVFVELLTGQAAFHRDAGHCDGYTEEVLCRGNKGPLREVC